LAAQTCELGVKSVVEIDSRTELSAMKIKEPKEFGPDDLEVINVRTVHGIYNGPNTLHEGWFKANAGPIHQMLGQIQRLVCVQRGQECYAFEQWLYAIWHPEINAWTVDHPNC